LLIEVEVRFNRLEGQRAIHGTGLKVQKSEPARQVRGKGALPRSRRSVYGDDRSSTAADSIGRAGLVAHLAESSLLGRGPRSEGFFAYGFFLNGGLENLPPA